MVNACEAAAKGFIDYNKKGLTSGLRRLLLYLRYSCLGLSDILQLSFAAAAAAAAAALLVSSIAVVDLELEQPMLGRPQLRRRAFR